MTFSSTKADEPDAIAKEVTPEQEWLIALKTRFDDLPQLHEGVVWPDVQKSLIADPESMAKLQALDEKGHAMNVFGEENGEFIFASCWTDIEEVSADHKNITHDLKAQKLAEKQGHKPSSNAVSIIAKIMGVKEDKASNYLADPKFHEQLIKVIAINGGAWLKTDAATRETGSALCGNRYGIRKYDARDHGDLGSFRAAVRVKKVSSSVVNDMP